jgi:hypothetical protein
VAVAEREPVKVNEYGEKCRRAGAFFQPLVLEARSGGMSKATAKIIKKHAMLAVLKSNLVAMRMPYGGTYQVSHAECRRFGSALSWCGRRRCVATDGQ